MINIPHSQNFSPLPSYWANIIYMLCTHDFLLFSCPVTGLIPYICYICKIVTSCFWAHIKYLTCTNDPSLALLLGSYKYIYQIHMTFTPWPSNWAHVIRIPYTKLLPSRSVIWITVTGPISYIIYIYIYIYNVYYMAQLVGSYLTYTTYTPWPLLGLVTYQTFTTYQQHNASYFHGVDEFKLRLTQYDNMHNVAVKQDPTKHLLMLINATDRSLIPFSGLNDNVMASFCEVSLSNFWFCLP